jgi:uncharacterized membrane protein
MEMKSKSWLESVTSIGGILAVLASGLGLFGITIPPETVTAVGDAVNQGWVAWQAKDYVGVISGVIGLGSAVLVFLGRYQGEQRIHFATPYTYKVPETVLADPKPVTVLTQALKTAPPIAPAAPKPPAA